MNKTMVWLFALIGVIGISGCSTQTGDTRMEKTAIQAAESWMKQIDEERYSESWENASTLFKRAVVKKQWQQTLNGVRKPLGKLLSRELISSKHHTTLPGVPDGNYVVIQYRSVFEHKKSAVETITPMLEKDEQWRVSGYFIK